MGRGPRTGRGYGPCGRGMRGHWGGFLRGLSYRKPRTEDEERKALTEEIADLEEELNAAQERLAELKN